MTTLLQAAMGWGGMGVVTTLLEAQKISPKLRTLGATFTLSLVEM